MRRLAIVVALVLAPSAQAADHLMHVNEVSVSPGDADKQFVELLDAAGEPFPSSSYTLAIQDSGGAIVAQQALPGPQKFAFRTDPYVFGKPGASNVDEPLTLTIPNAPGKACFHRGSPATAANVIHCLQYGSTPAGQSAQRQPCESAAFAVPTPGAQNAAVTGACGGGGGGGTTDRSKPVQKLGGRKRQRLAKLAVTLRVDEAARITATGSVKAGGRRFKLKRLTRRARAGQKLTLKPRLSRRNARTVRLALIAGRKASASLKFTAKDAAGNVSVARRTIRLRR